MPGTVPIWVSDRWCFHRPTWAGERVTATAELISVEERPGRDGRAATHVDRTSYVGEDGSLIAECFKTHNRYDRRTGGPSALHPETPLAVYTDDEMAAIADTVRARAVLPAEAGKHCTATICTRVSRCPGW